MTYTPIISLFEYCNIAYTDVENLNISKIKKQIVAEFAFTDNGILEIEGITFNKSDVVDVIETNDFKTILTNQIAINNQSELREFLIRGTVPCNIYTIVNTYINDTQLIQYISPYLAPLFNREMKNRLQKNDFDGADDWLAISLLITEEDAEIAFASIRFFLDDSIKLFKNLNKDSFIVRKDEVTPWTQGWASLLNHLPDSLFEQKEELAGKLLNFTVEIQHTDTHFTYEISSELTKINYLTPAQLQLIDNNHAAYTARLEPKESWFNGIPVWSIVIAIFFIIKGLSNCNNQNSNTTDIYKLNQAQIELIQNSMKKSAQEEVFEYGRNLMPKSYLNDYSLPFFSLFPHTISYFSIQNDSLNTKVPFTVMLKNNSTINLGIYVRFEQSPDNIEFVDFTISPNDSLFINKDKSGNIDFLLTINNKSISDINFKDVQKNLYYFAPIKAKFLKHNFTDTVLNINHPDKKTRKYYSLNFGTNFTKIRVQSKDLNLVKMSNP